LLLLEDVAPSGELMIGFQAPSGILNINETS
jgi:hypothetical protein